MRYLVLSDIHANLEAYETVMDAARPLGWDRVVILGDLVGYGADPNAIVERVRELAPHACIRGNHDKVGSGIESAEGFNSVARSAIRWTHDALTDDNRAWLAALPMGPIGWTRRSRSVMARPSTRTPTCSTTSTHCARCTRPSTRCACSGTRTCRSPTA
jgi:hypothetical protein